MRDEAEETGGVGPRGKFQATSKSFHLSQGHRGSMDSSHPGRSMASS